MRGQMVTRVKSAKKRSNSTVKWLQRQLNDPYVMRAKAEGFRSRAAFKLVEIDDKQRILRSGMTVVDLGAAPGGWTQVAAKRVRAEEGHGHVVAIDILDMPSLPGCSVFHLDFLAETAPATLRAALPEGLADVVLSDMAPATMGHRYTDHLRIMALAEAAAAFAIEILKPEGVFLAKVFQGGSSDTLLKLLKTHFTTVKHIKPPASRKESAELYVCATGFKGSAPDA